MVDETFFLGENPKRAWESACRSTVLGLLSHVWKRLFSLEMKNADLQMPSMIPTPPQPPQRRKRQGEMEAQTLL